MNVMLYVCVSPRLPDTQFKYKYVMVLISYEPFSILLVNAYMPCSENIDALDKYTNILEESISLCIKSATQHLILGGDWNADPSRNDRRTTLFKIFI